MRMYPALVNCTTIDLFNEWPQEALLEVGERYLRDVDLEGNEQVINCPFTIVQMYKYSLDISRVLHTEWRFFLIK